MFNCIPLFLSLRPAAGFGLGNTSFGTPTTTSSALTFGALSTPTTSIGLNFGFGSPATSTPAQCSGLLLGTNTATTMTTAPSLFPIPTTSAPLFTGLSFGTPATTNILTFGANTTATGSLTFGTATTNSMYIL